MSNAEKLEVLNSLRGLNGKDPLKAWKQSSAKLDEAIAKERADANDAEEENSSFSTSPKKEAKKEAKAKKPKGGFETIRSCAEHYLVEEPTLKHREVADKVKGHFPDAKTTAASVAWYASKLAKKK